MATTRTCDRCKSLINEKTYHLVKLGKWYDVVSGSGKTLQTFDVCVPCMNVVIEALGGKVEEKKEVTL